MRRLRVLFIHGLESSPQGAKARVLAEAFDARTPAMDTRNFEACVSQQAEEIERFAPDVVVGSSFGGAVAVALLQRGLWRGPTLLLAQAAASQGLAPTLPKGRRIWLVHGARDDLVPVETSRRLARTGSPRLVRWIEVDDDHRLTELVSSGRLTKTVEELAAEAGVAEPSAADGLRRFVTNFLADQALWPIVFVIVVHIALLGAVVLLFAARSRSPVAFLVLALLVASSVQAVLGARRRGSGGRTLLWLASLWALSVAAAVFGARYGVL
jgi:hypothetical protein